MKTFTFFLSLFFCISASMSAQHVYTWEEYGISFDLAEDFKEVVNNSEEFSAEGDGMSLSIIPFADADIDDADITAYTIEAAAAMNFSRIDGVSPITINGFKGGYAEVAGDGVKVFVMGLIDPDSDTNFFIVITFADGDALATEEAIAICQGLSKM